MLLEQIETSAQASWHAAAGWLRDFWRRSHVLLVFCFALAVLSYGVEVFNISLSIDEEMGSFATGADREWLKQDRWAMFLLNWALNAGPTLPFLSPLIALFANIATVFVLERLWGGEGRSGTYLMAPLVLLLPTNAFLYQFNTVQYACYVGLLLAVVSLRFFLAGSWSSIVTGGLLLTFAVSVYQPLLGAVPTAYFFHLLNRHYVCRNPRIETILVLRRLSGFLLWLAAAVAMHKIVASAVRAFFGMHNGYINVDSYYSLDFLELYRIEEVTNAFSEFLLGQKWYLGPQVGVMFLFGLAVCLGLILGREHSRSSKVMGALILLFAVAAPFWLIIATGRGHPTRALLGLPVMFGGLAYVGSQARAYVLKWGLAALVVVCSYGFVLSNNRLFYADQVRWMSDQALAYKIIERMEGLGGEGSSSGPPGVLVVVGTYRHAEIPPMLQDETFGASIFEWDKGNSWRIAHLLRFLGADGLRGPNPDELARGFLESEGMGAWPATGSVRRTGDVVVVKFGEPTFLQSRRLAESR